MLGPHSSLPHYVVAITSQDVGRLSVPPLVDVSPADAPARPQPQMLGQLPIERIIPGPVFDQTGVDYAGPVYIKYGYVRKPTVIKAYVCVFVSLSVKAVHLEFVSDLTSEAFIATLRRFCHGNFGPGNFGPPHQNFRWKIWSAS